MNTLIIVGAGDFAMMAARDLGRREKTRFAVERDFLTPALKNKGVWALEDLMLQTRNPSHFDFFVAVTFTHLNKTRRRLYELMKCWGSKPITYISSDALYYDKVRIGEHCYVQERNNLQRDVVLGDNVILWAGNHIGHGTKIGSHTYIASHVVISGNCEIGEECFIGVNASIGHNVKIGDGCIIGAGTLITRDIPAGSVVKRNADRPIPGEKAEDWPL